MTTQNAKLLTRALSLRGVLLQKDDEAISKRGDEIATHPAGARNDSTGKCRK